MGTILNSAKLREGDFHVLLQLGHIVTDIVLKVFTNAD